MRADRLLSILMLLQARGRMTAQELAQELEVSVRTIYRDMDALSYAGVPVYTERGPGGGCALLDSYRTTLTGLNQDQVRALFMLSVPAPLAQLGVDQELKAALLKLSAALPAARRPDEERARQRIYLDPEGWSESREPLPHLRTLHQAVWQDRKLHLVYQLAFGAQAEWLVEPYGLVAKSDLWYLVCARDGHVRALRVPRVLEARISPDTFERPADFDLNLFWQVWCAETEGNRPVYPATVRIAPGLVPWLSQLFSDPILRDARAGPPDGEGWSTMTLHFETLEDARRQLLGLGAAVEILAPLALRESVLDFATQVVGLYARSGST